MLSKGATVVGISTDSIESQRRFKRENALPFVLLSDPGGKVARQYGGTIPLIGLASRATYVVDRSGTVTDIRTGGDAIDPAGAIGSCPVHHEAAP